MVGRRSAVSAAGSDSSGFPVANPATAPRRSAASFATTVRRRAWFNVEGRVRATRANDRRAGLAADPRREINDLRMGR